jgi:hypothetical protein
MEVKLDDSVELFDELLTVASAAESAGLIMRLIGGAALQLWARVRGEQHTMTSDLDWALSNEDLPDESTARKTLGSMLLALREIGFERPKNWRSSRSARFQFQRTGGNIDVEFLCGELELWTTIETSTGLWAIRPRRE